MMKGSLPNGSDVEWSSSVCPNSRFYVSVRRSLLPSLDRFSSSNQRKVFQVVLDDLSLLLSTAG